MNLDIRVIDNGPLYERLRSRWEENRPGYISAYVLFLATPIGTVRFKGQPLEPVGLWYFPILIGLFTGPERERIHNLARRLLEATLRVLELLDGGEPHFLEVELTPELWPAKPTAG